MRFDQKKTSTIAISLLLLSALLACAGSTESPVTSPHSHEGHHDEKDSDGHGHDHHGSSNMMMSMSPNQADALIEIEFRDGEVITSANRVSISIGDQIIFSVVSDTDEFIHVHGVDFMGEVSANSSINYLGFTMEVPGIFEVEFENSGTFITELLAS
tara:strand:- start:504 stop:974 length:471 start_codon:yes stop_codon:yes gene_type:complete